MFDMQQIEKPWGHEEIWAQTSNYIGKILVINKGHQLSYQYHQKKEETILVLEGLLEVEFEKSGKREKKILKPGDTFHNPPLQKHRFTALENCRLVEVSTLHLDDVIRLEDDYGRS
ncbi:MAG: cupin domain-containing protein [Deltaproteobacteria bacterium]|nr:cupin domain-containing protein [Deltaproteobacteria bacterium]